MKNVASSSQDPWSTRRRHCLFLIPFSSSYLPLFQSAGRLWGKSPGFITTRSYPSLGSHVRMAVYTVLCLQQHRRPRMLGQGHAHLRKERRNTQWELGHQKNRPEAGKIPVGYQEADIFSASLQWPWGSQHPSGPRFTTSVLIILQKVCPSMFPFNTPPAIAERCTCAWWVQKP